ncbi:Uu.00g116320.m01.CDS01 [Anthostomella pinea]|uniref:Uu.00g116320.m01.CDS01 n=1 Tax=Anthostomella pinea TaxID=933095 RepID=A0AAI8VFX1_9PEZI|nr:Uu.00g116320.m01.CDS01 [Anthostomella pinea]
MSVQLNKAIADDVSRNQDQGVRWVLVGDQIEGDRFRGPGIKEPDQHNDGLWLFHYPYNESDKDDIDGPLPKAYDNVTTGVVITTEFQTYNDFQNALLDAMVLDDAPGSNGWQDTFWPRIGNRVKTDEAPLLLPVEEKNECHGMSGDYRVMLHDTAVDNAEDFRQKRSREVTYNAEWINDLKLSMAKLLDDSKGPADAPDCLARLQGVVIDGGGGADPINNQLLVIPCGGMS